MPPNVRKTLLMSSNSLAAQVCGANLVCRKEWGALDVGVSSKPAPVRLKELTKSRSEQDRDFVFVAELRVGKLSLLPHFSAYVVLCSQ